MEVKFKPNQTAFFHTLRARVNDHFQFNNVKSTGNGKLYLKTAVILTLMSSFYTWLVFFTPSSVIFSIFLCILLGITVALVGFNIMHDGSHGSYSSNKTISKTMALSLNLLGGNASIWNQKHNLNHHTYTNIEHLDDDIDLKPFLRLHEGQSKKWFHRYQHVYCFALYASTYFFWVYFRDFLKYFTGKVARETPLKMDTSEHIIFWVSKAAHITVFLIIPSMVIGPLPTLLGYVIMSTILGFILSVVFQLAHVVESSHFPECSDNTREPLDLESEWAVHQLKTTVNFATGNRFVSWMLGGLNYQVEHHLFPKISHVHYPEICRIVKETCSEFNIGYMEYPTVLAAVRSHSRYLKKLGRD
jgi:linoleoyl-CoA desaturase